MEPRPFDIDLLTLTLAFDSDAALPRRGVRKMKHDGRHLLFEADDLCVDLRLEPDLESGSGRGARSARRSARPAQGTSAEAPCC